MKIRIRHCYNALLGSALALLGCDSCTKEEPTEEYGAPYATYQIRGTVTDKAGNPIPGIKGRLGVEIPNPDGSKSLYYEGGDSALTDAQGHLNIDNISEMTHYLVPGQTVVELKDEDGEANGGEFSTDTLRVDEMKKEQIEKGSGWYQGKFEYSFEHKMNKNNEE